MIEMWYNNLANLLKEKSISPLKLRNKPLTDVSNPSQLEQVRRSTPTRSTCKYLPEEVTRGVNSKRIRKYHPFSSKQTFSRRVSFSLFLSPSATYARRIHYETKSSSVRRRRRPGDRESWHNIFPRLDLIKSAPVRRDERGGPHGSPALQTSKRKKGWYDAARQLRGKCNFMPRFPSFPPLLCPGGQEILETSRVAREEEMRQFFRQTTRVKTARREHRAAVSLWLRGRESPARSLDRKMIKRREGFGKEWWYEFFWRLEKQRIL